MKTLGQIAHEGYWGESDGAWEFREKHTKEMWEAAAKAVAATVRAETIEECARVCDDIMAPELWACAAAIRSLASTTTEAPA